MGRERRLREREHRVLVAQWYCRSRVRRQLGGDRIDTVRVMVAPLPELYSQGSACLDHVSVAVPACAENETEWRPRVSKLMWADEGYRAVLQGVVRCLAETNHGEAPLMDAFTSGANTRAMRYGAQSIERALVIIFYGQQGIDNGTVAVPESTVHGTWHGGRSQAIASMADRDNPVARFERLSRERAQILRVFARLQELVYVVPGAGTAVAQNRMADAYVIARVAQSKRGSMVSQLAMRVGCFIHATLRHLVPISPSSAMADVLAQEADMQWRGQSKAFDDALRRCKEARAPRST